MSDCFSVFCPEPEACPDTETGVDTAAPLTGVWLAPQNLQNLAVSGICAPQFSQNIKILLRQPQAARPQRSY